MRSEFEKIEWVKERLNHVWWSQENGYCDTGKHPRANASFLNGAWYAYQHQQSKVDELQKIVGAVKELAQTLWEKSEEKHQQGKVWESKTLGECADEILDVLEQALKGGEP